ncbi:MAG: formyl transferase [Thermodesulfobacteria bacterium]|nr:formyl transferase [Thermodesulfobacteriota bacterium]
MSFKTLGWLTSARDEAAVELLVKVYEKIKSGFIPLELKYVFLSREEDEGEFARQIIEFCKEEKIKVIKFSALRFKPELRAKDKEKWRIEFHEKVMELLEETDFCILAGYMWIVSEEFCKKLKLINLHPALPGGPKGAWEDVMWQLISARSAETGAMMHLVTPELDEGPAVSFFRINIRSEEFEKLWQEAEPLLLKHHLSGVKKLYGEKFPLFQKIREEELKREIPLIIFTLKAVAEGRVEVPPSEGPIDLSEEIEEYIKTL